MWSNTDKGRLERCDKYWKWLTIKMWSNTDKGQLERCDQIQKMMWSNTDKDRRWSNTDKGQRCDQIQIKVN